MHRGRSVHSPQEDLSAAIMIDAAHRRLRVQGELSGDIGAALYTAVQTLATEHPTELVVDLSGVPRMDSLGGAWLSRAAAALRQAGIACRVEGEHGQVEDFLQLILPTFDTPPPPPPRRPGVFESIGEMAFASIAEARQGLALLIDTIYWSILAPLTGRGLRWQSLLEELANIGAYAALIVALMNMLLGVVVAVLSAAQLRQFGATIYVADLVGLAFARELAALMTAIIVSARSGSAIAAELATMVVQEEIDALTSMGLHTAQFLIAPKLWAMLLALPALTVLAMFAGTFGGLQMGVWYLGISTEAWMNETLAAVTIQDVIEGLSKSVVFGATIVLVGCHNGLRVRGGAQGVGRATTRAVVTDVVCIIIFDMLFALFFEFVVRV